MNFLRSASGNPYRSRLPVRGPYATHTQPAAESVPDGDRTDRAGGRPGLCAIICEIGAPVPAVAGPPCIATVDIDTLFKTLLIRVALGRGDKGQGQVK